MKVTEIRIPMSCTVNNALWVLREMESENGFGNGVRLVCDDGSHCEYDSKDAKKVVKEKMTETEYMSRHRISEDD